MDVRSNSELSKMYISSEVRFYTINDLIGLLGWSEATVQKLFNAANFGRNKVVEGHALIDYFSRRRDKHKEVYWR